MASLEPQDSLGYAANAARDSLFKLIQAWVIALHAQGEGYKDDRLNRPKEVILDEVGWPLLLTVEKASKRFSYWIKRVTPGRIRGCYVSRNEQCKVQARNDLEYTSYIEAAAGELQSFIDLRIEDFMMLRLSEGGNSLFSVSPPKNLSEIKKRLAVELTEKQLHWWLEAMRDGATWSHISHRYPGIFSCSAGERFRNDLITLQTWVNTPAEEWQAFFSQVSREESMVRNDYPELFATTVQQSETSTPEKLGIKSKESTTTKSETEWSRPMTKGEAGRLYGAQGDPKAKVRFISNLIKDRTLITDQVDPKSRRPVRFDLSTVDEAVREKFRVQPSS